MGRSAKKQMLTLNFFNNENSKELFWKSDCDYKVLLYHLHNLVFKQFVVVFESKRVVTCMLKKYNFVDLQLKTGKNILFSVVLQIGLDVSPSAFLVFITFLRYHKT